MKLEKLVGERFKERPADCVIDSHAIMVKGGYIKYMADGIYSSYLPLRRIVRKIEQILREEMDKIDGQEVQFPVVMPASLWDESGRYDSIGDELLRFTDRNNAKMVLGMTHEEAVEVRSFSGLAVDFAKECQAHTIVRGLRAITDFEYELQMAQTNRVLEPEVDTTFLITSLEYAYLSSTVVKEVAAFGGDIHKFVPDFVEKEIRAKYAARNSEGMPQDKR